jgi:hypothetical protein
VALKKPIGTVTRGTTNPNRLRRVDRYIASLEVIRKAAQPILVDLGYGASPITAIELLDRVRKVNPECRVIGVEIDRERVERGLAVATEQLNFVLGGFEVPMPASLPSQQKVDVIRAFNVLRQYSEAEVEAAWALMRGRLSENGVLVEGTCDEIGRLASWVTLDREGPKVFTISLRLGGLDLPSKVAERLPKALIHHNLPGEQIHDYLQALDACWRNAASLSSFGAVQRWIFACQQMADSGWPIVGDTKRWKLGEISVDWSAVAATAS